MAIHLRAHAAAGYGSELVDPLIRSDATLLGEPDDGLCDGML
jgi:hypothetical protein